MSILQPSKNEIKGSLNSEMGMSGKQKFQKLTPMNNAQIGVYKEALDYVFDNDELRNVAISGPYGSGKSTVLESYKSEKKKENGKTPRCIHISLANFQGKKATNSDINKIKKVSAKIKKVRIKKITRNFNNESILERKILNQLIHQISEDKIPQTNFKLKKELSDWRIGTRAVMATVFFVSLAYLFVFVNWEQYRQFFNSANGFRDILANPYISVWTFIILIFVVSLFGIFLYCIIKMQRDKGFIKKFSYDKLSVELFKDSEESYFDRHLDEVLYLLDKCEADVIVFEDIDRFNSHQIFARLREINILINEKRKKREKDADKFNALRFLYLIRDDLLSSKERTKFFDFIIPVIPVIDNWSSYDKLIEHLEEMGIQKEFNHGFLRRLSTYIDDMRILNNICNEFLIYDKQIGDIDLKPDKLMGMITYKNIFPYDFSELQLRKGFVHAIFDNKKQYAEEAIKLTNDDIEQRKLELQNIEAEHLNDLEKIEANFEEKKKNAGEEELLKLNKEQETETRKLEERKKSLDKKCQSKIDDLAKKAKEMQTKPLKDIISLVGADNIFGNKSKEGNVTNFDFKEIRENEYFGLLRFLIVNGYVDETYADYMAYFYPNSISRKDYLFVRGVWEKNAKSYDYPLENVEAVFERLEEEDFAQPEILNYDLLFYLLKKNAHGIYDKILLYHSNTNQLTDIRNSEAKKAKCLIAMMERIFENGWSNVFLKSVFEDIKDERLNYLVLFMHIEWPEWIADRHFPKMVDFNNFMNEFILRTLLVVPDIRLEDNEQGKENLVKYMSENSRFFNKENFENEKLEIMMPNTANGKDLLDVIAQRLKSLELRVKVINKNDFAPKLFETIYNENLYDLSFPNIKHLLEFEYGINPKKRQEIKHRSYTMIRMKPNTPLEKTIEKHINFYVGLVLENCDDVIADNEDAVLAILNNNKVTPERKSLYSEYLITVLKDLPNNKSTWKDLIEFKKVEITEENVIRYFAYCENKMTKELVGFINSSAKPFDFANAQEQHGEEICESLFNAVVECNEINDIQYRAIISKLDYYYGDDDASNFDDIESDKMKILIECGAIEMNESNLEHMREIEPASLGILFIVTNIVEYCTLVVGSELFDEQEAIALLSENISDKFKLTLLEHIENDLSARNEKYSDKIRAYILKHNYLEDDLEYFVENYANEGIATKAVIVDRTLEWATESFDELMPIAIELVDAITEKDAMLSEHVSSMLFACVVDKFDATQCQKYLKQLKLDDFARALNLKRPKILKTEANTRILDAFKKNGWIGSYKQDEKNIEYYQVFGCKIIVSDN